MFYKFLVSPVEQRAQISDDGYQTVITIPSAKKVIRGEMFNYIFMIIMLLFIFIPTGLFMVVSALRNIRSDGAFPLPIGLVWTGLFAYSLWIMVRMAAWRTKGQETITADPQRLTIRYDADPWRRKTEYELGHIQSVEIDIRPREAETVANYFQRRGVSKIRSSVVWRYTTLRFRYGRRTVRFGREITREDAEMIREAINRRLTTIAER